MKIIVFGSSGFIGSNALKYFQEKYDVYGCDVVAGENNDRMFYLDKRAPDFDSVFKAQQFDVCINASGSGSVAYSIINPAEDHRLNCYNVFLMLTAISKYNKNCRFINFSSAAVYGNPGTLPVREEDELKPVSPYGFHKLMSEKVCQEFYELKKIYSCSMRVFSAYGMGLRKQLFWDIYQKILSGNSPQLFGTGKETRDFIFIDDLLHAIECIIDKSLFEADIVNVASSISTTIEDAAVTFVKNINDEISVTFNGKSKDGDPLYWQADIAKISSFGFSPKVTLAEGLKKYYEWILKKTDEK